MRGMATTEAECTGVRRIRRERNPEPMLQVQRILRTRHECPRVTTAAHEKRVRGELDDLARGVVELAAARKGTPAPVPPLPNITKGYRGGLRESSTSWRSSAGTL